MKQGLIFCKHKSTQEKNSKRTVKPLVRYLVSLKWVPMSESSNLMKEYCIEVTAHYLKKPEETQKMICR